MSLRADVLLITVNRYETKALVEEFSKFTGQAPKPVSLSDRLYRDLGTVNGARVFHALSEMGSGGLGASLQTVQKAIEALDPAAVIAVGIAFGINEEKQAIGDVLLSKQLRPYDLQRVGPEIILRGDKPHASPWLINYFEGFAQTAWKGATVRPGVILTGDKLIDSMDYRDQLLQFESEAVGGEMEGAGLYVASQDRKIDWIVIKAICDWGDGQKAKNKSTRQKRAAKNATAFVLHALQQSPLKRERPIPHASLSPQIAYQFGMFATKRRLYNEALDYFRQASQMDPTYLDAFVQIAWLQQTRGHEDAVRGNYEAAVGKLIEAQEAGRHTDPYNPYALALRGFTTMLLADIARKRQNQAEAEALLQETKQLFERAAKLDPQNPSVMSGLAAVSAEFGDLDTAIEVYQHIVESWPDYVRVRKDLAIAYEKKMRTDTAHATQWCQKALNMWRQFYALGPKDPTITGDYLLEIAEHISRLEARLGAITAAVSPVHELPPAVSPFVPMPPETVSCMARND